MPLCAIRPSFSINKVLVDSNGDVIMLDTDTIPATLTCQPTGTLDGYAANPYPTSIAAAEAVSYNRCRYTSAPKNFSPIEGFPSKFDITSWQLLELKLVYSSGSLSWRARVKANRTISGQTNYLYYYQASKPFTSADSSPKGTYSGWTLYSGSEITPAQITLGTLTIT